MKYSRSDKVKDVFLFNRLLWNYEYCEKSVLEASEILSRAYDEKENFAGKLSSVLLGRIVNDLWDDKVKLARRGPRKDRRTCYLNLRCKEDVSLTELPGETFDEFRGSSLEMERGWSRMSDSPNNVSFLRFESCSFNNQRFSTEVKITKLSSSEISYSLISHGCESDIGKFMDISYIERYPLSQRINLILAFVNNAKFCKGTTLEDGETTTLPHVTGQYVDFSKGKESEVETRVFSDNCNIITVKDGTCCANCRNIKILGSRAKCRRLARDSIHSHTNKRYLSKSEVVQQLAKERQARQNAEKRERYWREKFDSQCLEMAAEDHDDLSQMFSKTDDQNVPTEMACLWEQQKRLLQCKTKNGYRWHPK